MDKIPVKLYVYDISRGFARQLSPLLLGKRIDGVWHTGVVCYGREFFYGGGGIESCLPGGTILGSPDEVVDLGDTEITQDIFVDYLAGLGEQDFRPENYHLFEHNCNTFSSVVAVFLTGNKIPQHIQDLPSEVLNTSFGQMIRPLIDSMSVRPSGGTSVSPTVSSTNVPDSIFEPRGNAEAPKLRKQPDGCQSSLPRRANTFSQNDIPLKVIQLKEDLARTKEFPEKDLNHLDEMKNCFEINDLTRVKEIQICIFDQVIEKYITQEEEHPALQLALQLLQVLSLCEELFANSKVIKDIVKKTCRTFSSVNSSSRQVECTKLFCCVTSHKTGHSFMFEDSRTMPLAAITVNCLLSKDQDLQTVGAALVSNISRFEIHEDVALECSTAVIEVLSRDISPETGHNCLYSLRRFMDYNSEVTGLANVMGVSVDKFKGSCSEVDELCSDLEKLLR